MLDTSELLSVAECVVERISRLQAYSFGWLDPCGLHRRDRPASDSSSARSFSGAGRHSRETTPISSEEFESTTESTAPTRQPLPETIEVTGGMEASAMAMEASSTLGGPTSGLGILCGRCNSSNNSNGTSQCAQSP